MYVNYIYEPNFMSALGNSPNKKELNFMLATVPHPYRLKSLSCMRQFLMGRQ
jgi:hypothetical protein